MQCHGQTTGAPEAVTWTTAVRKTNNPMINDTAKHHNMVTSMIASKLDHDHTCMSAFASIIHFILSGYLIL